MLLKIDGRIIKVESVRLQPLISKHSGNELELISCEVRTRGERNNQSLLDIINKGRDCGADMVNDEGSILKHFTLQNSSYSFSGQAIDENTLFTHTFTLEEKEVFNLDTLVINGIHFKPYQYSEEFSNDDLVISAKLKLEGEQIHQFMKIEEGKRYFPVIRKSINDEPISMRFGKILWSEHEGFIKKDITLVQQSYDSSNDDFKGLLYPDMPNIKEMLAFTKNFTQTLTNTFVEKNILTEREVEKLKQQAIDGLNTTIRLFDKVTDIDE